MISLDSMSDGGIPVSVKSEEAMERWQSGIKSLSAGVKHLYNTKVFSDAVYRVNGVPYKIHTTILKARSEVFENMYSVDNPRAEIFDSCSQRGFENFLRYCYTDELQANDPKEILDTYRVAKKFKQNELISECQNAIEAWDITQDNVFTLLNDAIDVPFLGDRCMRYITANSDDLLKSSDFKNVTPIVLFDILNQNCFSSVSPSVLVKAVLKWGLGQFPEMPDYSNIRDFLQQNSILGKIKIEELSAIEILSLCNEYQGLFTPEEAMQFQLHALQPEKNTDLPGWCRE